MLLQDSIGNVHEGGTWPTVERAGETARGIVASLSLVRQQNDPLEEHRGKGATLLVTFDQRDERWAIVAGYQRPVRFLDTGIRRNTEREARELLGAQ